MTEGSSICLIYVCFLPVAFKEVECMTTRLIFASFIRGLKQMKVLW